MTDTELTTGAQVAQPVLSAPEREEEARRGRIAGFVTMAAALLIVVGLIWSSTVDRDDTGGKPVILAPEPSAQQLSKLTEKQRDERKDDKDQVEGMAYPDQHAITFVGSALLTGLAFMLFAFPAARLFRATRARNPQEPSLIHVVALYGPIAFGAGVIVRAVSLKYASADFVDQQYTTIAAAADEADDLQKGSLFIVAQALALSGFLALAFWLIKGQWDASKVGLLTKPYAILGMGLPLIALLAAPLVAPIALIWFVALGALLLGYWPGGLPPAWGEGRAIAWPSRADSLPVKRPEPPEVGGERNGDVVVGESGEPPRKRKRRS